MKITLKVGGTFTGAKSGKVFRFAEGDKLEVSEADLSHLDKKDYVVAEAEKLAAKEPAKK